MNLLDLMVTVGVDDKASKAVSSISDDVKSKMSGIGSAVKTGFAAVATGATAAVGALVGIEAATEEYRVAQGKLNTAFETAGYSTDSAKQAYTNLYAVIGDTDTAAEAAQLMAKLSGSQEDLGTWTNIATGVMGTFGDALPINSLMEAANETSKTGTVVGVLADALNWAGISEDEFNEKLAACGSESERNQLIMDTLSGTYSEAADSFRNNNSAIMEARENQVKLQDVMSKVGEAVTNAKNALIGQFAPAIEDAGNRLSEFLNGLDFSGLAEGVGNAFNSMSEAMSPVMDAFNQIKPVFEDLLTTVSETFIPLVDDIKGAWSSISEGVGAGIEAFGSVVRDRLIPAVEACKPVLEGFFQAIQDAQPVIELVGSVLGTLAGIVLTALVGAFNFLVSVLTVVINAITGFVTFLMGVPDSVSQFVTDVVNWFQQLPGRIQEFLSDIISKVQSWASDMISRAQQTGSDFLNRVVEFFTQLPGKVQEFLSDIISKIQSWASDMVSKAQQAGSDFLNGVVEFFTQLPGKVQEFLSNTVNAVSSWVYDMVNRAQQMGSDFLSSVANFLSQLPGKVQEFLSNVISSVGSWAGDMANKAMEAGQSFLDSVSSKFDDVVNFFYNVPGNIVGALGDLGSLLWDAGKSIIDGLWDGLESAWNGVVDWFGDITSSIPNLKGPIEVDSKLLLDNGEAIMGSLYKGLSSGWKDVEDFLSDKTSDIGSSFSYGVSPNVQADPTGSGVGSKYNAVLDRILTEGLAVYVDGKKVSSALSQPMNRELGKLAYARSR